MLDYKIPKGREINHHRNLLKILRESGELRYTAFVSLNYDIIVDNAITDRTIEMNIDYGIRSLEHSDSERIFGEESLQDKVLLLKPHGSLNWLYCPTCKKLEIKQRKKEGIKAFYGEKNCARCGTNMEPVIIPPTLYKEFRNPFVQEVYLNADEILRNAERIFICGYSFPDADFHIKYLLKRAEQYRRETPEIYIMNFHKDKKQEEKREEEKKFYRFFKDKEKVHYTDFSFERFAEMGIKGVLQLYSRNPAVEEKL